MRISTPWVSAALLAVAIASCAPLTTRWDYDPDVDFARYKTFGWMPKSETSESARATWDNPFLEKRIKQAVIGAMQPKGLEFAKTDDEPDLLIAYHVTIKQKTNVHVYGYPYWGPYPQDVQQFREGTLIIDLVDPQTRQLVWRGWGVGDFDEATRPQTAQGYIDAAVKDILKHYPPYPLGAGH